MAENCCTSSSRFNISVPAYPRFADGVGEGMSLHDDGDAVEREGNSEGKIPG